MVDNLDQERFELKTMVKDEQAQSALKKPADSSDDSDSDILKEDDDNDSVFGNDDDEEGAAKKQQDGLKFFLNDKKKSKELHEGAKVRLQITKVTVSDGSLISTVTIL